jgi:hypothetical protein
MLCWGENPWGVRRLLAYVRGIPPKTSAFARKALGEASDWDNQTELAAVSVEFLQMIFKALGGQMDFHPIERPYATKPPEPETTVSAGEIMNFLKGF